MSGTMLVVNLVIAIAIILFLILKAKVSPVIAMVIASIYMGLASGIGFAVTADTINKGFGGLMVGIGLPIGLGIMLGEVLSEYGGAKAIAYAMIRKFPGKKAPFALGLTAFLVSIPVFFDVTFVILIPLGLAVSKYSKIPLPYAAGAIAIGGVCSQTFVPPTPNPLAAASILKFDLGMMVVVGLVIGLAAAVFSMKMWFFMLNRGWWNKENDETGLIDIEAADELAGENLPSAGLALLPIVVPVICILLGTTWKAITGDVPGFVGFLSDKTTAILLGLICVYLLAKKRMSWQQLGDVTSKSLKTAGIVLMITGAGGSFGAIIQATGIGKVLTSGIGGEGDSTMLILAIAFGIGVIFRVAQGSGTVASITAMTIMADVAGSLSCHPVYLAIAALAGGNFIGHVNDSGFWVVTNLSGFSVTGGFKTYTFNTVTLAGMAFILAMLGAKFLPMVG